MGPFAVIPQQPRDQLSVKGRWLHEQVLVIIEELFAKATVKPLHMKLESCLPSCYSGFPSPSDSNLYRADSLLECPVRLDAVFYLP